MTDFELLDEFPKGLLSAALELLAERKVNHPEAALTLSPDDLASSWDLVAESAVLPDPPAEPSSSEDLASSYWYEQSLGELLSRGLLVSLEDSSYSIPDLERLWRFRDTY